MSFAAFSFALFRNTLSTALTGAGATGLGLTCLSKEEKASKNMTQSQNDKITLIAALIFGSTIFSTFVFWNARSLTNELLAKHSWTLVRTMSPILGEAIVGAVAISASIFALNYFIPDSSL